MYRQISAEKLDISDAKAQDVSKKPKDEETLVVEAHSAVKQVTCALRRCQGRYGCQCTAKQRVARAHQQAKLQLRGKRQQSKSTNWVSAVGTQQIQTMPTESTDAIKAAEANNTKKSNRVEVAEVVSHKSKSKANLGKPFYCFVYGCVRFFNVL